MLPKNRRISPVALFSSIFKKSLILTSEHFKLRTQPFLPQDKLKPAKISISIPRRVNQRAVDRHANKRKISAIIENNLELIKPGQYLIFQVEKDISKIGKIDLINEIKNLIK